MGEIRKYRFRKRWIRVGTLKRELIHYERYAIREQAKRSIFEYIEVFYNRQRRHRSLDHLGLEAFEASRN